MTVTKNESEEMKNKKIYVQTLKPLLQEEEYGLVSDLIVRNPSLKSYMSKSETGEMMDYYEKTLYTLSKGLEKLLKKAEGTRK